MKNKFSLLCGLALATNFICAPLCSCSITNFNYKNEVKTNFGGHHAFNYGNISESTNDVHVETFYQKPNEKWTNNANFAQAVLLNQCINFKKKHPDKETEICISSFHFSYMAAACVDKAKPNFGKMLQLKNAEENNDGYVRISYLLIKAARAGIKVWAVGHIAAKYEPDIDEETNFEQYFESHMNDLCDDGTHTVKDYLVFKRCKWTGYGEKSATDLMHVKNCTVSNYTDDDGIDHDGATYVSSANMDAIQDNGMPGNPSGQTATIVSDHPKIATCFLNYTKLLTNYCEKEDSVRFRELMHSMNVSQIDQLTLNPETEITNQIVYLGSEKDKVFELYLTPFGGSASDYDIKYNPFAKYITKFAQADANAPLNLLWTNSNFVDTSEYTKMFIRTIDNTLYNSKNTKNKLVLGFGTNDPSYDFANLIEGVNIGVKSINRLAQLSWNLHCKDLTLKYSKNGVMQYVTLLNTINFHLGSGFYQSNSVLVIKETTQTHNSAYVDYSNFLSLGVISKSELI